MNDHYQDRNRQRLLASACKDPATDCWLWQGQISNSGYGRITLKTGTGNRIESAQRASYLLLIAPLQDTELVRQTCGNRLCINPDHLETFRPA